MYGELVINKDMATSLINNCFDDDREIVDVERNLNFEEEICYTDNDEIIIIKSFNEDVFDSKVLAEYTELTEKIYFYFQKKVYLYILTKPDIDISVKECNIKSEADFVIKVANPMSTENLEKMMNLDANGQCDLAIQIIRRKMTEGNISKEDIEVLDMIPMLCEKEDRKYYREIVFNLLSEIEELNLEDA